MMGSTGKKALPTLERVRSHLIYTVGACDERVDALFDGAKTMGEVVDRLQRNDISWISLSGPDDVGDEIARLFGFTDMGWPSAQRFTACRKRVNPRTLAALILRLKN